MYLISYSCKYHVVCLLNSCDRKRSFMFVAVLYICVCLCVCVTDHSASVWLSSLLCRIRPALWASVMWLEFSTFWLVGLGLPCWWPLLSSVTNPESSLEEWRCVKTMITHPIQHLQPTIVQYLDLFAFNYGFCIWHL